MPTPRDQRASWLQVASAGAFANTVEAAAMHPLDTIKTRYQLHQASLPRSGGSQLKTLPSSSSLKINFSQGGGPWSLVRQAVAEDGVRSLYRGIGPAVGMQAPRGFYKFGSNRVFREGLGLNVWAAGVCTGVSECLLITPFEWLKVRMQARERIGSVRYRNSWRALCGVLSAPLSHTTESVGTHIVKEIGTSNDVNNNNDIRKTNNEHKKEKTKKVNGATKKSHCGSHRALPRVARPGILWRGLEATCWRNGSWNGVYFGLIGLLQRRHRHQSRRSPPHRHLQNKNHIHREDDINNYNQGMKKTKYLGDQQGSTRQAFLDGCLAGTCGSFFSNPFDVLKSRIQNGQIHTSSSSTAPSRPWALRGIVDIWRNEGLRALYSGLTAKVMRLGPGGGILLLAFEFARGKLQGRKRTNS